MKKLLLISLILILGVSGFSVAISVGIGFNLDMSSGSVVTPFFLHFAARDTLDPGGNSFLHLLVQLVKPCG